MKIYHFIIALVLLASCDSSDFEGYKKLEKSVHYKWLSLGDGEENADNGESISLKIWITEKDSVLGIKRYQRINPSNETIPSFIRQLLTDAHQGDSVEFMGTAGDLHLKDWSELQLNVGDTINLKMVIDEVLSQEELKNKRAEERLALDAEMKEQEQLTHILDSLSIDRDQYVNGIYYKTITRGNGKKAESGDHVRVNYVSRLANGTLVDDTYSAQNLEYEIGRPDQVIEGFSIGMALMREGSEAIFVIPSQLAFGERGSSSGIVPPFHTVIYQVKLEKVGI